jgi:hypothetical protein
MASSPRLEQDSKWLRLPAALNSSGSGILPLEFAAAGSRSHFEFNHVLYLHFPSGQAGNATGGAKRDFGRGRYWTALEKRRDLLPATAISYVFLLAVSQF